VIRQELARLAGSLFADPIPDAPDAEFTIAPKTAEDAAAVLGFAATNGLRILFWGGGTHQAMGYRVEPDIIMSSAQLDAVADWQPEDLTVVVQPGVRVTDLEARLEQGNQTAVLPEDAGSATIGGVIAAGISGWRRLRYGPSRDRMLEVRLATGDGRLVRGGARLVKNVTGYDLPRLVAGSFGSLGMITEMCVKLWPSPARLAMVRVDDPERALARAYRPLALIETPAETVVYLAGSEQEIAAQVLRVGGEAESGHRWPEPLVGNTELILRVEPSATSMWAATMRKIDVDFQAAYGVGEIRFVADGIEPEELNRWRTSVERMGGAMVVSRVSDDFYLDPWGAAPTSVGLQRRVKAAFDPRRVANPGILPGGI